MIKNFGPASDMPGGVLRNGMVTPTRSGAPVGTHPAVGPMHPLIQETRDSRIEQRSARAA
ncbi:hypothetical protein KX928_07660 [Roseobacter sp. YSTF-M11]|uniref:Uncharacterized protein n=1 Tax=Roseobacter insulae TaxID=2859783 RepID=A0A9X1FTQ0_9RHOB|nr:hypothetical protein [Roseobacter insulae]MBW4707660.1 hypothetical protein [Roseobacter insulae]